MVAPWTSQIQGSIPRSWKHYLTKCGKKYSINTCAINVLPESNGHPTRRSATSFWMHYLLKSGQRLFNKRGRSNLDDAQRKLLHRVTMVQRQCQLRSIPRVSSQVLILSCAKPSFLTRMMASSKLFLPS